MPFWKKTDKHSKPQSAQKRRQNAKPAVPWTAQQSIPMQLIGRFIGILRYSINNTKHNVTVKDDLKYTQQFSKGEHGSKSCQNQSVSHSHCSF